MVSLSLGYELDVWTVSMENGVYHLMPQLTIFLPRFLQDHATVRTCLQSLCRYKYVSIGAIWTCRVTLSRNETNQQETIRVYRIGSERRRSLYHMKTHQSGRLQGRKNWSRSRISLGTAQSLDKCSNFEGLSSHFSLHVSTLERSSSLVRVHLQCVFLSCTFYQGVERCL